jgi:hypothetical protein
MVAAGWMPGQPCGGLRLEEQGERGEGEQERHGLAEGSSRGDEQQRGADCAPCYRERRPAPQPWSLPVEFRPGSQCRAWPGGHEGDGVRHVGGQRRDADRQQRRIGDQRGGTAGGSHDAGRRPGA